MSEIIVIGAGMTGLITATLLARDGHQVTVLDRDPDGPPGAAEAAWETWARPGVSQFRQLHFMLPAWRQVMEREIPEILCALTDLGATWTNTLHMFPESVTAGWQRGDEQFETLTARRPVLETALAGLTSATPGVRIRRGLAATDLLVEPGSAGVPAVVGVRTRAGDLRAQLVVDAGGRRTPVPGWVRESGAQHPLEHRDDMGLVYYPRHYRSRTGRMPRGQGGALAHHQSFSVLTLPADNGIWSVAILTSTRDRELRVLRDAGAWEAALRCIPEAAPWVDAEPITDVRPFAGIQDVQRSYVVNGAPVVTGLVSVGDAWTATNPSLGRGATIGALQACVLRDVAAGGADPGSAEFAGHYAQETDRRIGPLVTMTLDFGRHRLAEMDAEIRGVPYQTGEPSWPMTVALMAGARLDPVLARACARIGSLLATQPEVMADPDVRRRLPPYSAAARYPAGDCTRAELLAAVTEARLMPV